MYLSADEFACSVSLFNSRDILTYDLTNSTEYANYFALVEQMDDQIRRKID